MLCGQPDCRPSRCLTVFLFWAAMLCGSTGLLVNPTATKKNSVLREDNDQAKHRPKISAVGSTISTEQGSENAIFLHSASSVRPYYPDTRHQKSLIDTILVEPAVRRFVPWQDEMYDKALHLKCPFLRRRAIDAVEYCHSLVQNVLDPTEAYLGPCPSLLCHGRSCTKRFGLSMDELLTAIQADWKIESSLGYYVTGRLSTDIYRDDCLFDGPDPDMPVVGLRKYIFAASQLFDQKQSWSKLESIEVHESLIVANWQFGGVMRLPWKPVLPVVCGSTTYHVDNCGLIYKHVETWDLSVQEAFTRTFFPSLFPR